MIKFNEEYGPWNWSCDKCESVESRYPCPLSNCSKHGNETINWRHGGGCKGGLRLYSNGKEKCQKCGEEEFFCLWDCSCADESKNNQKYDYSKIRNIFANAIGIDTRSVSPMFLIYVAACIDKQYQQHPERFV